MVIFNEYHIICLEAARRRGFGGLNEYKSLSRGRHDVKKSGIFDWYIHTIKSETPHSLHQAHFVGGKNLCL